MSTGRRSTRLNRPSDAGWAEALGAVVRDLRLRGTVYFSALFAAPWGLRMRNPTVANFHYLVAGDCWVRHQGGEWFALRAGTGIVFPRGAEHELASAPSTPTLPAEEFLGVARRQADGTLLYGTGATGVTMICGHFDLPSAPAHPLLAALPDVLHFRDSGDRELLHLTTQWLSRETSHLAPLGGEITDRCAEILLLQIVRQFAALQDQDSGFFAALRDPGLARALTCMHTSARPEATLPDIAREAGMSRSAFAARFSALIGTSPMEYVSSIRMRRARELLLRPGARVGEVGLSLGFAEASGFSRAFKRTFGFSPSDLTTEN